MGNIEVIWAFNDGRTENTGGLKVGDNFVKYSFEKQVFEKRRILKGQV